MNRLALPLIAAFGCGDNTGLAVDASATIDASAGQCTATFHGNFAEVVSLASRCAKLTTAAGQSSLVIKIPIKTIASTLEISVDLGNEPAAGEYTVHTVEGWKATAVQRIGNNLCLYSAGANAVPQGTFDLTLSVVDVPAATAQGALSLTLFVLSFPDADCGDHDTETLDLTF